MTSWNPRANDLFLKALEIRSHDERLKYLNDACTGDAALRAEVQVLLEADAQAGQFLEPPLRSPVETIEHQPVSEGPGTLIGPYKLLEQIGEGGFGVVFMAEQTQPVRRRVALKVLKPGMDTRQVVARFEAERQALALMDHPNIAQVFDGGETVLGRPYFVMELVRGIPVTDFCDQSQLTLKDRLDLFIHVCHAVQHAHHKGIIHRDIKPSNVLVTLHDNTPVAKVIDFGIAKAKGQQLTDKTLFTNFAQMIGTPLYMSPEQAGLSGLDADTRSDIYSLGVLLYELLTGTTPFDKSRFREAGYDELRRIIREEEPPKPSTRMSTLGQEGVTVSVRRQSNPKRLSQLFRGELDWIVMKALEKDRNRRYETANAFASDLQRYLKDEPVLACPPSSWYRLRKFAQRNKTALGVAVAVLFLISLVGGGAGWILRDRAARQAREINDLELAVDRAEMLERIGKRPESQEALEQAELLASRAADMALETRLAVLKERLASDARDKEFVERFDDIRLREQSRVNVQESRYILEAAFPEIRDALRRYGIEIGAMAPAQAASRVQSRPASVRREFIAALVECFRYAPQGDLQTQQWLLDTLAVADNDAWRLKVLKAHLDNKVKLMEQLADKAEVDRQPASFLLFLANSLPSRKSAIRLELFRRIQCAYPADLWANEELASELLANDQPEEAVRYYTAALALRPDSPGIYVNRGKCLEQVGELDAAITDYRTAIRQHKDYATAHCNLGKVLQRKGNLHEAVAEFKKAIELDTKYAQPHNNLGMILADNKQWDEAIAEYKKAIELNSNLAQPHNNLGNALTSKNQWGEAIAEYKKAIECDPKYVDAHNHLGRALQVKGQWDEAIEEFKKTIELNAKFAEGHNNLGFALKAKNRLDEAIEEYKKAIELDPKYAAAHFNLGRALHVKKRIKEAVATYKIAIDLQPDYPEALCNLGQILGTLGELSASLDYLKRGHALGTMRQDWRYPSAEWVTNAEQLVRLEAKLADVVAGKAMPMDNRERLGLLTVCHLQRRYVAATRVYAVAFAADPKFADDLEAGHRYDAACYAVLSAGGQGTDAGKLDDKEQSRLRRLALVWLRADLQKWSEQLDGGKLEDLQVVRTTFEHWRNDADLTGIREPAAISRLPAEERDAYLKLWADVDELLQKTMKK